MTSLQGNEKKSWSLTAPALDGLLQTLDPDRERAAVAYEQLRSRVTGLLGWWGSPSPAELADETLDRVARKIADGVELREGSFGAYVRGVARMVFRESSRAVQHVPLEYAPEPSIAPREPADSALPCLDRCLGQLDTVDRSLLLRYYDGGDEGNIARRKQLAAGLGVSMTALRVRAHRLRARAEECVRGCLERGK